MGYLNMGDYPMIFFAIGSTRKAVLKHQQRQGYGATNGETILFMLIVDCFDVDYVGRKHTEHLALDLKKYHEISEDWEGKTISGIDLIWDYASVYSPILGICLQMFCFPNPLIFHGTF